SVRLTDLQRELAVAYPSALLLFRAGAFAQAFNEDALILHKGMEYKLVLLGGDTPYLRAGFPWNNISLKAERIQEKLHLDLLIVDRDDEGVRQHPVYISKRLRKPLRKIELVDESDVIEAVQSLIDEKEIMTTRVIGRVKSSDGEFVLRRKLREFTQLLLSLIANVFPRKYRYGLGGKLGDMIMQLTVLVKRYGMELVERRALLLRQAIALNDAIKDLLHVALALACFSSREHGLLCIGNAGS
ncbi:MAG: hypothetical protein Q9M14_06805, partial [Mariprofundaceae bacterium]|nr:hypothetical protein [Mariprofundaceae bacterium]